MAMNKNFNNRMNELLEEEKRVKQILIYMRRPLLKPVGGPIGYNYNLSLRLQEKGVTNIHYIESSKGDVSGFNQKVRNLKIGWLRNVITIAKSFYRKFKLLYGFSHKAMVDLNQFDIVHFQSTMDLFDCRDSLKHYKGKVVLTSHSPTVFWKEMFAMLTPWEQKHMRWFYKNLKKMDTYAFYRADYIVFPCESAEEPYFNSWPKYKEIHDCKKNCYRYVLSGINDVYVKETKETVRQRYGIPMDAFVVSYVGRHNEIKGYDILKNLGEKLLQDEKVWILVAGREGPLYRIQHSRWIEIGWTTDPHSPIAASDVFVLPNRETYFDLVMLELLALGQIVVASYTGGNKYFENLQPNGILLYKSQEEALAMIEKISKMSNDEKALLKKYNRTLYEKYFTASIFADNYIEMINSL